MFQDKTENNIFLNYFQHDSKNDLVPNIPNEIFNDLTNCEIKSFRHRAFAYSFYYLSSYLYRNSKYGILTYLICILYV